MLPPSAFCKKTILFDDFLCGQLKPSERRMPPDWQEILSRDAKVVWQTAYRLLGNRDDADECLQEAFLAALEVSRREDVRHWRAPLPPTAAAPAVGPPWRSPGVRMYGMGGPCSSDWPQPVPWTAFGGDTRRSPAKGWPTGITSVAPRRCLPRSPRMPNCPSVSAPPWRDSRRNRPRS